MEDFDPDDFDFGGDDDTPPIDLSSVPSEDLRAEIQRREVSSSGSVGVLSNETIQMTLDDGSQISVALLPIPLHLRDLSLEQYQLHYLSHALDRNMCYACLRSSQIERKPINVGMALTACWMCGEANRRGRDQWINMQTDTPKWITAHCRDYTVLERWGLIERPDGTHSKAKADGLRRPTQRCFDWVRGKIATPLRAITLHNNVLGYSIETVSFVEASQRIFDFDDLWAGKLSFLKVKKGRKWVDPE